MRTFICRHCGRITVANKKLKHRQQRYCGDKKCQAARKHEFERNKYKTDSSFRSSKLQRARVRRIKLAEDDPLAGSLYQRNYRLSHPEYVTDNRKKQRLRNSRKGQKTSPETKIVNPDALMLQKSDNDTVYAMIAVDYQKIVNPDTFVMQCIDMEQNAQVKPMFVRLL